MAIDSIGSTGSSASSASISRQGIADNFDTFLQLLTTQLRNQNPLDPLDTNAFTQQLVQFSSVEQQLKTNDFLSALVQANTNSVQTNAVNYIGKTISAAGVRSELINGKAEWNFSLEDAANTTVTIKDKDGNVVYTETGDLQAGVGKFTWDGKTSTGTTAPDGDYTITVAALDSAGQGVLVKTEISGRVDAVDMTGDTPQLVIGSIRVPLGSVKTIGLPAI